jgi:hypothetical protein
VKTSLALACILAALPASAAADPAPPKSDVRAAPPAASERSRLSIEPSGHAFNRLAIDNPLGDLKIEGYDGTAVQIEAHKFAADDDALDRLHISLVPNPDGTVSIKTTADGGKEVHPVARGAVRIDLTIRAPRDARVEATVSNGLLEVVDMDAGGDLDTAGGPISVRNVQGELLTHSVSGATRLAQVFGSVDAQTLSSDVDLDTIGGERLIASVNHGSIAGRRVRAREVELTAMEGRIVLEAEAALRSHFMVSVFKGDVDVQLRRHGNMVVRARGTKVDLGALARSQATLPEGWVQSTLGSPEVPGRVETAIVELRAPNGNVRFAIIETRP